MHRQVIRSCVFCNCDVLCAVGETLPVCEQCEKKTKAAQTKEQPEERTEQRAD